MADILRALDVPLDGTEPTIWVGWTTMRKDGSPVMGTLGSSTASVVVMTTATWQRLIDEHPSLQAARFRVGGL